MASYTITTTDDQEAALTYMFAHLPPPMVVPPEFPQPPPNPATQAEYLQQQVDAHVLNPMIQAYVSSAGDTLAASLATIPEANRPAAKADLEQVITDNGGTLPDGGVSGGVFEG